MPSVMFIVPAHGRAQLAQICLKQLRHTCDQLENEGIRASAVVIAADDNLDTARDLGFGTVRRDNEFVSRKFNDGIQLACDPEFNPQPADYVIPCGSDDWVDWRIFTDLPPADTILCFQKLSFVREDGREMTCRLLRNTAGCGIRVYPWQVMAAHGYRPADEDRKRACDTSILTNLRRNDPDLKIVYGNIDARQIVDWKSPAVQLNPYESLLRHHLIETFDPFDTLAGFYPDDSLAEMQAHYEAVRDREPVAA